MEENKPTVTGLFVGAVLAVMNFYDFEGVSFWQKWTKLAITATVVPVLFDLLPGEPVLTLAILMVLSFVAGVVGLIVLLILRIIKEYQEGA